MAIFPNNINKPNLSNFPSNKCNQHKHLTNSTMNSNYFMKKLHGKFNYSLIIIDVMIYTPYEQFFT